MNVFYDRYQTYSNTQLIEIIQRAEDYQPEAVEAAKQVISKRNLSISDLASANQELEAQHEVEKRKAESIRSYQKKASNAGRSVFKLINPVKNETDQPGMLKTLTIGYIILSVIKWVNQGDLYLFTLYYGDWDIETFIYMFEGFALPIGTLLLAFRKKVGWILLTGCTVSLMGSSIDTFIYSITYEPNYIMPLPELNSVPPIYSAIGTIIYLGMIIFMMNRKTRKSLNINLKTAIATIVIAGGIVTWLMFHLSF